MRKKQKIRKNKSIIVLKNLVLWKVYLRLCPKGHLPFSKTICILERDIKRYDNLLKNRIDAIEKILFE